MLETQSISGQRSEAGRESVDPSDRFHSDWLSLAGSPCLQNKPKRYYWASCDNTFQLLNEIVSLRDFACALRALALRDSDLLASNMADEFEKQADRLEREQL